jgi:hypothetical protein
MESVLAKVTSGRAARAALLFLLFVGLVASRRWQQLTAPQVWAEDGRLISTFMEQGWSGITQPVNGYLILVPRVITNVSLLISGYYYPMTSTLLACGFAGLVGVAVALSPTELRAKVLCAAAVFLVPSDAEVFGPPLYTLWWAPILLLLVALWDRESPAIWLRLLFVAVGGLSSPYILVVLPILWIRCFRFRKGPEAWVAMAATVVAAIQGCFILRGANMASPPVASFTTYVVPRFGGWFWFGGISENSHLLWPAGILLFVLITSFLFTRRHDVFAWILVYLYLGAVASSILRNDPAALHPFRGGPRYFFFPFFLTSWILVQLALTAHRRWLRNAAAAAALVGALNALPQWTRRHDDLHWSEHLLSARLFPRYEVPIESDGHWFRAWGIDEPGTVWDRLLQHDPLLNPSRLERSPTYAYRIVGNGELNADGWVEGPAPAGGPKVLIPAIGAQTEKALELSRGRRVRFRCGPNAKPPHVEIVGHESEFLPRLPQTNDWVMLEFSNSRLPREFAVRVIDQGQGVGDWALATDQ